MNHRSVIDGDSYIWSKCLYNKSSFVIIYPIITIKEFLGTDSTSDYYKKSVYIINLITQEYIKVEKNKNIISYLHPKWANNDVIYISYKCPKYYDILLDH